ncbi:MAG: DUF2793 domain-containing protein [Paracoccus sp. (in: a-proteobacteria)]|nr:DUF2793 domain-containing protein [Paracoccus sp. (in: a-proteobacteria)]
MSENTVHLALPYIMAAQAQKHVIYNEALRLLDGIVQLSVLDRFRTAPPGVVDEGSRFIVASGATGAWTGWDGSVAYWIDGAWMRILPAAGWLAWVVDESAAIVWDGSAWVPVANALGSIAQSASVTVARAPNNGGTGIAVAEQLLAGLSGASRTSTIVIPNRAIVLGVSCRTVTAITGATSYDCGIAGQPSKFGGSLGVAVGSTNIGVVGPEARYADTPIVLTANGANFTGGAVRIAAHYLFCNPPT